MGIVIAFVQTNWRPLLGGVVCWLLATISVQLQTGQLHFPSGWEFLLPIVIGLIAILTPRIRAWETTSKGTSGVFIPTEKPAEEAK